MTIEQSSQQRAPLNNSYKFFVANIDFHTTAAQVDEFFGRFGNVNQVRLLPPQGGGDNNNNNNNKGDGGGQQQQQRPLHRGHGFLFMLDEPSTSALERHVNTFPDNKIEMMGRKGVHVRRQVGMGRAGGNDGGVVGDRGVGGVINVVDHHSSIGHGNAHHPAWAQYYDYDMRQQGQQYGGAASTTAPPGHPQIYPSQGVGAYDAVNYHHHQQQQQHHQQAMQYPPYQGQGGGAGYGPYPTADYYANVAVPVTAAVPGGGGGGGYPSSQQAGAPPAAAYPQQPLQQQPYPPPQQQQQAISSADNATTTAYAGHHPQQQYPNDGHNYYAGAYAVTGYAVQQQPQYPQPQPQYPPPPQQQPQHVNRGAYEHHQTPAYHNQMPQQPQQQQQLHHHQQQLPPPPPPLRYDGHVGPHQQRGPSMPRPHEPIGGPPHHPSSNPLLHGPNGGMRPMPNNNHGGGPLTRTTIHPHGGGRGEGGGKWHGGGGGGGGRGFNGGGRGGGRDGGGGRNGRDGRRDRPY